MTLTGSIISPYEIGLQIGRGSFGMIYAARNMKTGELVALKFESKNSPKKVLSIEAKILKKLTPTPFFPQFYKFGKTKDYLFISMELMGPSLSYAVKNLPGKKLSLSTGLRMADITLSAIETLHHKGILHRDIKPSNVLIRRSQKNPLTLVDFGLSRVFTDSKGNVLPPRENPGFRGTAVYASPNAHLHLELGPRDDLISWLYMIIDTVADPLPWRHIQNRADVLQEKRSVNMERLTRPLGPEFFEIWKILTTMPYPAMPNYARLHMLIHSVMERNSINRMDKYDWDPSIIRMDPTEVVKVPTALDSSYSTFDSLTEIEVIAPEKPLPGPNPYNVDGTPLLVPRSTRVETFQDETCCCFIA